MRFCGRTLFLLVGFVAGLGVGLMQFSMTSTPLHYEPLPPPELAAAPSEHLRGSAPPPPAALPGPPPGARGLLDRLAVDVRPAEPPALSPEYQALCAAGTGGQTRQALASEQSAYFADRWKRFETGRTEPIMLHWLRAAGLCEMQTRRVVDVGVNMGTNWLLNLCPGRGVDLVGVEANPAGYAALLEGRDPKLIPVPAETTARYINVAVSDQPGSVKFFNNDRGANKDATFGTGASGLIRFMDGSSVDVEAKRLDTIAEEDGWFAADADAIALLKLDIESYEPKAFLGAQRVLAELHPPVLVFECSGGWNRAVTQQKLAPFTSANDVHQTVVQLLDQFGYETFALGPETPVDLTQMWVHAFGALDKMKTRDCAALRRGTPQFAKWTTDVYETFVLPAARALRGELCPASLLPAAAPAPVVPVPAPAPVAPAPWQEPAPVAPVQTPVPTPVPTTPVQTPVQTPTPAPAPATTPDMPTAPVPPSRHLLARLGVPMMPEVVPAVSPEYQALCSAGALGHTPADLLREQTGYFNGKWREFETGRTEPIMLRWLRAAGLCEMPARRVVDVGVNMGTDWLLNLCPGRGVDLVGVEANPAGYAALLEGRDPKLIPVPSETTTRYINMAVSDAPGSVEFYNNDKGKNEEAVFGTGQSGLVKFLGGSSVSVEAKRLDTIAEEDGWFAADADAIALLKLDIESYEPKAFLGAQRVLAELHPPVLVFECSGGWNRAVDRGFLEPFTSKLRGSEVHEAVVQLLDHFGYETFALGPETPVDLTHMWSNVYGALDKMKTRDCAALRRGTPQFAKWTTEVYERARLRHAPALREKLCG